MPQEMNNQETNSHKTESRLYYPKTLSGAPAYIFDGIRKDENAELVFVPDFTLQPRSFVHKVLKFLFVGRMKISGRMAEWFTGYKGWQWLTTLRPTDRLLLNGVTNLKTLRAVKWLAPKGVRLFQYFNNCLRFVLPPEEVEYRVRKMQEMGYTLVTFDPQEAEEYQMVYAPQFFRFPDTVSQETPKYDFFFCGEKKDRGERLAQLQHALEEMGYKCLFIVVGQNSEYITYEQYLKYVEESKCLIDLFQEGQVGITRRPMEALFFNKKLLTENPHIAKFDFFHPENILITTPGDPNKLDAVKDFMETPCAIVPDDIKQGYSVEGWLKYFE